MTLATVAPVRRVVALRVDRRAAAFGLGFAVAPVLAANGGYFPTSWGWMTVGFAWAAALGVLFVQPERTSWAEWAFVGGLGCLALWTGLSTMWSIASTQSALETERTLALVAASLAVLTVVGRAHAQLLLRGAFVAAASVSVYALGTRLFPDRFHILDDVGGYRLSTPVGYWNALGFVAAIAALLAMPVAAGLERRVMRTASAALMPLLLATLYFTFSRGAWLALLAGLVALFAYAPARLALFARLLPTAAAAGGALLLASHQRALTHLDASASASAAAGHRLAWLLLALATASALAAVLVDVAFERLAPPTWVPRVAAAALVLAAAAVVAGGIVRFGAPQTMVRHAYDSFVAPSPRIGSNLNARLFNLSGSGRWTQWRVALHAFESRPLTGVGAGGYERYWLQHRPVAGKIRDAHNLYLEVLAELGVVGLALLVIVLTAPFLVLRRARHAPLAPVALAAYVAYIVHAVADWDWELSGVTLLGLFAGACLLVHARRERAPALPRPLLLGLAVFVGALGLVGLAGNIALSRGATAARAGNWAAAAHDARRAETFAPWSAQPWQQLGEARLGSGDTAGAQAAFHRALRLTPGDWNLWFDLARATTGQAQQSALAHAARLNSLSPEIAELRTELGALSVIDVVRK